MEWADTKPTTPGFYWHRTGMYKTSVLYCVYKRNDQLFCRRSLDLPCDPEPLPDGQWTTKITPPE